jgi:hypothetical protein
MKHCNTCTTEKDNLDFHKRAASIDGLAARCKCCQKVYDKKRADNPDRVELRRLYALTTEGIAAANKAKKKWYKENKNKVYQITKSYRENNPKKYKAHGKVAYEVKIGNMTRKPCEVCGEKKTNAHHDDYNKQLDVRWLCSKHHHEWHKENGEGLNSH